MNIVKGVADLIRRSSSGQSGEYNSSLPSGRFSPPTATICFSEAGDEAILKALWVNYAKAVNEVEKRKLFHIFLKQFLIVFRNWRPINFGQLPGQAHYAPPVDSSQRIGDVVVGCYFGHPIEIILTLIEELSQITTLLADNQLSISTCVNMTSESWLVLDALTVVTLSIYNCKVFAYHSGIQKLTALMKAAVVVLRTITSALSADEILSTAVVDNAGILQKILVYVVSVICNFVDIHPIMDEAVQLNSTNMASGSRVGEISPNPSTILKSPHVETILFWHQTTVISVMEAGGLNWLTEIMRVMRRLNMKEQWIDMSLQFLTLRALRSALADNPRGQNHFRSIGGLEVILDGLGVPSVDSLIVNSSRPDGSIKSPLQVIFDHHVLSMKVLREAVFGNFNNLQFLYENGRVHKFANSFCSLAFMIQEYIQSNLTVRNNENEFEEKGTSASKVSKDELSRAFLSDPSFLPHWEDYTSRLTALFCHVLLEAKETELCFIQPTISKNSILVTEVYAVLAVKWFTRVLLTVFQCIKACSDKNEMPSHLRIFAYTLQHCVLSTFRKVLVSSPSLVDVFRTEGVWDFIFSENFFYFGPAPAEILGENWHRKEILLVGEERYGGSSSDEGGGNTSEVGTFQIEVISFVEFAACLSGSSHNLPECAVLLDALEQSACNLELAAVLAKSLLHILQLSAEKTVSSFKALDVIPRILQIACIQAHDFKRPCSASPYVEITNMVMTSGQSQEMSCSLELTQNLPNSLKMLMDIFAEYFSTSDDAKISVLHSYTCINCIFDLFWEEGLRNRMLKYVLDLMKIVAVSEEDQKAKLFLCSKYLETFTHLKDRVRNFADLSIDLLVGMRDMLLEDAANYQALFREGGCFLHVVSLLNGNLDGENRENLVLNVIQTLTSLLSMNDASKVAFRALVGKGYQTFQSLLLEFCRWQPSDVLLNSLLDMLVDGKFDLKVNYVIKNEDVILLYFNVLQKSSDSLKQHGLGLFLHLLRDSLSNRASCVRAGMLNFLLNWFSQETGETMVWKIAHLIQVIGGHSISGKDIRKIFALLRSDYLGLRQHSSLLLTSMLVMLKEKGPTAFFDLNGIDSGIVIKTPVHWPVNKGFSFTCWLRVESFPQNGAMGLFSFLTENGRGCYSVLVKDKLIYEAINQKQQCVSMDIKFVEKNWHFLSLVHSVGRAFSSGSQLKCYLDGVLLSSEKCRYAKINEPLTRCTIGTKPVFPMFVDNVMNFVKDSRPFLGQIGPTYLFSDAISSEHVQSIYSLGPSYMYYFHDYEISALVNKSSGGVFDSKDVLASKIIFGLNAQASNGRALFNVTPTPDHVLDKFFEATVSIGTQLCSRRLLQQIVYCVGGVSVLFPLLTQFDMYDYNGNDQVGEMSLTSIKCCWTAETIKLMASIMDNDLSNQQQMFLLSGFSVLGFLLRSVPPKQLNLETLSALKHLFNVVVNDGMSELLVKDAISCIFLNPYIWVGTVYKVQRELYMFLIQQFDDDPRLLKRVCRLPHVLDIIKQFYSENVERNLAVGNKLIAQVLIDQVTEEKLSREETRKIRLLLLSLGEMSLREQVTASDIKAFVAFFETCQDMECVEDILNMIIRAVSQKQLLVSFLEQVNLVGGCHIFANLLWRDMEPVRLLGLQFIGRLVVDLPIEKKGPKFFNIAIGRSKSVSEGHKKMSLDMQPIFPIISDRLFNFPQTEILCATLFDVLLGGASPKQVLQKHNQFDRQSSSSKHNSQFVLPQALSLIFRFLSGCEDATLRMKIMGDLLDLLESNPSNIEAMMENGWNTWLIASTKLDVIKNYKVKRQIYNDPEMVEQNFVKNVYILVLCYYMHSVKGGWQNLEETSDFLIFQGGSSYQSFLHDLYEGLIQQLINFSAEENIFVSQPSRDNTLYLLKLIDEKLISEIDYWLPFPASSSKLSPNFLELENSMDFNPVLFEALLGEPAENLSGIPRPLILPDKDEKIADEWWNMYDNVWIIIRELISKAPSTLLPRSSSLMVPSIGQRARGLVESLNIPTAEMAAVVSGGISSALVGKPNRSVDKAMLLRGERCSRLVYRLTILYLCRSSLGRASQCVQRVISILPFLLTADDEQSKNRLHLFIWALFAVRSQYGMHDDGARFHVIYRLLAETINSGKAMLATSIMSSDDFSGLGSNLKEGNTVFNFIQKDRLLGAVSDEIKYIKTGTTDQSSRLDELRNRMEESSITDSNQKKAFEDLILSTVNIIIPSDDDRRSLFQRTLDEEQQIVAEKWIHTFRLLIDERGPWSANPFPSNTVLHWKLDKTEDAWRRRQKLRRNYHFNDKLYHPSSAVPSDAAVPSFNDESFGFGALTLEKMKKFSLKGIQRITDEGSSDPNENETQSSSGKILEIGNQSEPQYPEVPKESGDKEVVRERKGSVLLAESENSEVLMAVPCVLVTPKRKLAGRLEIMKNFLHFFGEFLVEGSGGSVLQTYSSSSNFDASKLEQFGGLQKQRYANLPLHSDLSSERQIANKHITSIDGNSTQKGHKSIKRHRWWNLSKIKAVHWTRYLLRYTAIEIFFVNSAAPIFLNFASQKESKNIGSLIVATRNECMFLKGHRDKTEVISFVDRHLAQVMAETARENWRRREITNFEYLMILNTLSGRSYNDLTQYPVLPWIIADYVSEILDLKKSATFRDLSKPVGALDPKRFEVFEDRYCNFSDPDIPSFYYGSHYSSMGIVLFYLLRLEPFTALHRNLQGGKFDHADRLFQSIEGTYKNCLSNTSDVKELIPEFFYMPEFLINSNSYHFGVKQDGEPISDVSLPPWAKGSPEEFINKNREALESEYVSSNLHHWIDLVFGYKQRGKPAVEAANVFYYLTYEGAVNLEDMEDELQRAAIEDQIANFGQTPIQLFRKKHPRRGPPIPISHPLKFAPCSINLTSVISIASNSPSAVLYVNVLDSNVVFVNQNLTMTVKMWLATQLQSGGNFTFSGSQDPFFGIGADVLSPCKIGSHLAENIELGPQCFAALQTPSEDFLITCGTWENSFQVMTLGDGTMVQSIRHHKDVVSCVAVTADGSMLATGSYDTTVMVWEVLRTRGLEKRYRNTQTQIPWKDCVIADTPFHILCGHDDVITCIHASADLDLVISGSHDGTCIFHTLREGRYVRSLRHPCGSPLSKLVVSHHGLVVLYADDDLSLHLYSINGRHISSVESNGRLSCLELSKCGEFLVSAGDQGQIVVRSMSSLEILQKYAGIGKLISSLTVTPEECFIAGTRDGNLLVYSIENQQLRKSRDHRNTKYKASAT